MGTAEVLAEELSLEEERAFEASHWRLMWWRFRRHRMAMISIALLSILYFIVLFPEFVATQNPIAANRNYPMLNPQIQRIHLFDEGRFSPFIYGLEGWRDPVTLQKLYKPDESKKYPIRLFVHGNQYKLLGLFDSDIHLFGPVTPNKEIPFFVLGTDQLGRDMYSRLMYATRISLTIGLVGVTISLVLGILLGGISGYFGGWIDIVIQRMIEFLLSLPTIPLWLGLSAALPIEWSVIKIYLAITVILSIIGWTGLARVVRGRFLSLREEDFVLAAQLYNSGQMRIILRYMLPSFTSHIVATVSLRIPGMILAETSLSFLGLGMRPPAISYGVLLQGAQNIQSIALAPWLLIPGLAVVVAVLAYNFLGDGIRDAADPYQA